ncbi:bifunctional metallophosphatase/5'-nucleotidase [Nicoliella spurrieriana]|uniref:Bifunctional metallophosphatase/5'-nucleotidase n=1 Tax=Nicoliella spurrieriana TaxID=2925830 RepID=A0A976RSS8_9LACO|nr:bifunctional UDP-sugar hydrolase/5'-nucleotidase [Nicoliella spurrieriana]UQS87154.1 bifunctional metallophosphatase/5'-nucleotidase [Nicoliella spurrieriana]
MKLTILSTSDTHGFIEPTNYVSATNDKPFGLERAAACINKLQTENDNTITIDNGDYLEGSPLAYYIAKIKKQSGPDQIDHAFNMVNYDYGILGNHEFNYGLEYMQSSIHNTDRQILCANIVDQNDEHVLGAPYAIQTINGINVGIIGMTTRGATKWESSENIIGLKFLSVAETAKKYVPIVRQKADIVIVAYHGGFERNSEGVATEPLEDSENESYAMLRDVPGIDALVTGHQHRKIAEKLFNVPVTQPGHRGEFVGKIDLDIQHVGDRYQVVDSDAQLVKTADYAPDQQIKEYIKPLSNKVNHWLDEPLSKIDGSLYFADAFDARINKTSFIEFIQKVQMETMGVDISATALFNNEAHGFENPITMRNIMTNYVYPNKLAALEISGADLKAAMEISAKYFAIKDHQIAVNEAFVYPKARHYNYDMYEGVDYTIKVSNPVGHRIMNLTYHGQPVHPDQKLKIALNQYRASGGGHFPMFSNDKVIAKDSVMMSQLIANYLRKHPYIKATNNHNFHVVE